MTTLHKISSVVSRESERLEVIWIIEQLDGPLANTEQGSSISTMTSVRAELNVKKLFDMDFITSELNLTAHERHDLLMRFREYDSRMAEDFYERS